VGRHDLARRLLGSLQVDLGKTRELLGWRPPQSVDLALEKTARHFLERIER
jgi:UDP-glucose 4-epimerase